MTSFTELQREREDIQNHLVWLAREIEAHIEKHGGKTLTSCHKCLNFQVGFRVDRQNLEDVEKLIAQEI